VVAKEIWVPKDAELRLQETIRFIRANPLPNLGGDFNLIVRALNTWDATASPGTRRTLSLLMSQEKAPNRPNNETDRNYRRACILVKCALVEPETQWVATAALINNFRADFASSYKANVELTRDALYSSPALARENVTLLKTHTRRFLNQYKLIVNGRSQAQRFPYGFYMDDGSYRLNCLSPFVGKITEDAINVPATPYVNVQSNLGSIQATLSSIDNTCDLMLTTQFTGCCYCFMVNGANLAAAHIDPQGRTTGITGLHIAQQLRNSGGFSNGNGGTFKAYGRVDPGSPLFGYPQTAQQMIIVAVKRGGGWRVYAQIDMGTHITVDRIH
jgi:hypothetical protein